jgi:adenylosuccinate synthase
MQKKSGRLMVVVGGQYGSEGKGVIVAHIANQYGIHVRVGGSNAGHSFVHKGKLYAMQTIPCGWINPRAMLIFGAGGLLDIPVLKKEMKEICQVDPSILLRFFIDAQCGVISDWHRKEEGGVLGDMHQRIGSTGKGVGAARRDRLMRDPEKFHTISAHIQEIGDEVLVTHEGVDYKLSNFIQTDTAAMINQHLDEGTSVLIEGTQGSGLSLVHGPWPYVTSADTNAAQMLADVGVSPMRCTDVMLVARTYPIRVAGNSGPMENETDWSTLSGQIGKDVIERTTVTKKVRRVAKWDEKQILNAVMLNQPTEIALTFIDYLDGGDEGKTEFEDLSEKSKSFVRYVELLTRTRVTLVGTGGEGFKLVDRQKMSNFL